MSYGIEGFEARMAYFVTVVIIKIKRLYHYSIEVLNLYVESACARYVLYSLVMSI